MGYPSPDVVVMLPGITGSELAKGHRTVWGWSGGVLARNLITAGGSLRRDLAIPEDSPFDEWLDDGIVATRMLPDLHLVPGLWKVDGYGVVEEYLKAQLELREQANYFPFPMTGAATTAPPRVAWRDRRTSGSRVGASAAATRKRN